MGPFLQDSESSGTVAAILEANVVFAATGLFRISASYCFRDSFSFSRMVKIASSGGILNGVVFGNLHANGSVST